MLTQYLTAHQIASVLRIDARRIQHLFEREKIPHTRYRRRVIVKLDDLIKWLLRVVPAGKFSALNPNDRSPPEAGTPGPPMH